MNKLIIAAAGSGKTTYLVDRALKVKDKNVLITTYTEANEDEIKKKIAKRTGGILPQNVTVQTWFSFLLQHGVRPYQSTMNDELDDKRIGFWLSEKRSGFRFNGRNGPVYWGEDNFYKFYFTNSLKIYSDKTSKFVVNCNQKTKGAIIQRVSRIYDYIFVDEVQDLAGWDLEILKLLFASSSTVILVGDPRQVTYLTHHSPKHPKYKDGKIKDFIENKCKEAGCEIDETTLNKSHRNNREICLYSSKLFPQYAPCVPCECEECQCSPDRHVGVYLVRTNDTPSYIEKYKPTILREKKAVFPEWNYGKSKGLGFDRVLIYPTAPIKKWIKDKNSDLKPGSRCKFYVGITRAKYSVGIVYDFKDDEVFVDVKTYLATE